MAPSPQEVNLVLDPIVPVISAHNSGDLETVARDTGLDPHAAGLLFDVLVATGYVRKCGNTYELTEVSQMTLLESSPMSFVNWVRFCRFQIDAAGHRTEVARGSDPANLFDNMAKPEDRLVHQRAIAETARPIAPWIADAISLPDGATRMLDIGCSHGVYPAGLCAEHPPLRSDIIELPEGQLRSGT